MNNKDLILQTSVELFNQHGTASVTTNQIAKVAGISPGNLYYHYQNKEHIIREIYEQMIHAWDGLYGQVDEQTVSMELLRDFIAQNFTLLWQYRFFNREMVALLNSDPILFERHVLISQERFQRQSVLFKRAVQEGLLHLPNAGVQLEDVLAMVWIIANHYLTYLESMGQKVTKDDFDAGASLILKALTPYFSEDARKVKND